MDIVLYNLKSIFASSKLTSIFAAVTAGFSYLFQVASPELIFIIILLMMLDTITGLTASWKEGKQITSRRGMSFVIKVVFYFGSIVLVSLLKHAVGVNTPGAEGAIDVLQSAIVWWIIGLEAKSNLENLGRIRGAMPEWIRRRVLSLFNAPPVDEKLNDISADKTNR